MTWEQIKNLTPSNGAIQDLKELLIMTNFTDEDLERFFTFRANVTKGDKLGWTGEMSDIGWAGSGCGPTYKKSGIWVVGQFLWNGAMKSWKAQLPSIA